MPEIYEFLFDVHFLMKLFPKQDSEFNQKIDEYENQAQEAMAKNRLKLFSEYGYNSEFDEIYS